MSRVVLKIELTDKNVIKVLGVCVDENIQGYLLCLPKRYEPIEQAFSCTRKLHGIVWKNGTLENSEPQNFVLKEMKGEYVAPGTAECKNLSNFLDKQMENLEDDNCHIV